MKNQVTYREECLKAANACVNGEREMSYGSPEDNFNTIANLWNAYMAALRDVKKTSILYLSPIDVAMMMALLKIARVATGTGSSDNFIDIAGYAACGYEIYRRKDSEISNICDSKEN